MKITTSNRLDAIISHESGELSPQDTLELFSHLIKSKMAYSLQGHYGRTAEDLISNGYLDNQGKILKR